MNIVVARTVLVVAATVLAAAPASAQDLKLTGAAGQVVSLAPAEIAALPHVTLKVQVEGKAVMFSGVPLSGLLVRVDAPYGPALHGTALADAVIVTARDGYTVVLALAETDPAFRREQVILADSADGAPLPDTTGPYRLVVEGDLRAARSARMVVSIEVRRLTAAAEGQTQTGRGFGPQNILGRRGPP
jgi:hypothetical protein